MSERDVTPFRLPFSFKPKMVILIVLVLGAVMFLTSSFYMVDQTEESVVLLLGRFDRISGPGLHFKLPFGIERNYNVPTQVIQNMSFGFRTERAGVNTVYSDRDFPEESVMLTGDLNIVDVEWIIQYRISDPRAWLFNVQQREQTIRDISQSVINQLIGDRTIFDVLGPERANIEVTGQEMMNEFYSSYGLGVNVTSVKLQNIVPPKGSVQDAFEDVNRAEQDMNRLINEGKEEYNRVIPRTSGEATRTVEEARGYAARIVNEAEGDVARFRSVYEEYRKAPEVTRRRLYFETMEDLFSGQDNVELIDKGLGNFIPFKALQNLPNQAAGQGGKNE